LGKEHDGVKVIIEMIHGTRLDSATSSAALMRQALVQVNYFFSRNNYRFFCLFNIRQPGMHVIEKHLVDY